MFGFILMKWRVHTSLKIQSVSAWLKFVLNEDEWKVFSLECIVRFRNILKMLKIPFSLFREQDKIDLSVEGHCGIYNSSTELNLKWKCLKHFSESNIKFCWHSRASVSRTSLSLPEKKNKKFGTRPWDGDWLKSLQVCCVLLKMPFSSPLFPHPHFLCDPQTRGLVLLASCHITAGDKDGLKVSWRKGTRRGGGGGGGRNAFFLKKWLAH